MGWWSSESKKTTVESCKSIRASFLKAYKSSSCSGYGTVRWTNSLGEVTGGVGFEVFVEDNEGRIRFQYTHTSNYWKQEEYLDYEVKLVSTLCHFGGRRWWFICPLITRGIACNRRAGVLYLRSKYFGCRHCHNLTYKSCQEHDKRVDNLVRNPDTLTAMLKSSNIKNRWLALKAKLKLLENSNYEKRC